MKSVSFVAILMWLILVPGVLFLACNTAVVSWSDETNWQRGQRSALKSASTLFFENQSLNRDFVVDVVFVGYNQEVVNISAMDSVIQKQYELNYSDVPMSYVFDFRYFFASESYCYALRSFILENSVSNSWTSGFNETAMLYQMETGTKMAVFLNQSGRAIDARAVETWLADNPCEPQGEQVCTFYVLNFTDFDSPDHLIEHWYNTTNYDVDANHIVDFPPTGALNNPLNPVVRCPLSAFSSKQNLIYIDPSAFNWLFNYSRVVYRLEVSDIKYQYFYQDLDAFLTTYDVNTDYGKSALGQYLGGWIDDFMFNIGPDNFLPLAVDGYSYMPTLAGSFSIQTLVLNDRVNTGLQTEDLFWVFNATVVEEAIKELLPYANPKSSARFADFDDYPEIASIWEDCIISVHDGQTVYNGSKLWYALDNVRQKYFNLTESEHVVCCYAFVRNNTVVRWMGYSVAGLGAANQVLVFRNKPGLFSPIYPTIRQKGLTATVTHEMGHCLAYMHTSTFAETRYPHYAGGFMDDVMGAYTYGFCRIRIELFRRTLTDMKLLNLLDKLAQDEYWYNQGLHSVGIDFLIDRILEKTGQVNSSYERLQYLESVYLVDEAEQLEGIFRSLVMPKPTSTWPMFHNDPIHSGYSDTIAPVTSNVIWSFTANDWVTSSPAFTDGRVYVGSFDKNFYCLNASSGTLLWSFTTGGIVLSSPAVAEGKVYFGSHDGNLYCLNALTGDFVWSYLTNNEIHSSPAVVEGRVYVGSLDDIFCLDANTGALIWKYTTGDGVQSSPAAFGGRVYAGSWDGKVYCLNASTGESIWNYTTEGPVAASPAVVDGRLCIGSLDHKVYCLNASSGELIWNYETNNYVSSCPAVAEGKVYVGSEDHSVYCLNATTGELIWSFTTAWSILSSPAVADGKVYVGSLDDSVYCLDASTGEQIWSYETGGSVVSSPAVANGVVYVGTADNNKTLAFGPLANHNVTIADIKAKSSATGGIVGQNFTCYVTVSIQNIGDHDEASDVSVFANTTRVAMQHVTLTHGAMNNVSFRWNTTSYSIGNYMLWAYVCPASDEENRADNIAIGGVVRVVVPGDVDGSHIVNMLDLYNIALHYGAPAGDPDYVANYDIDDNGVINMLDLYIAATHFGQAEPLAHSLNRRREEWKATLRLRPS